jgi:hypothetical protein
MDCRIFGLVVAAEVPKRISKLGIETQTGRGDFKYGALGDVDNDGLLDIVVGSSWFENPGDDYRSDWSQYSIGYDFEPDQVHLADLNGDQRLDIVVNNKHETYWLPGPTDPRKSWKHYLIYRETYRRTGGELADIDSDGDVIRYLGLNTSSTPSGRLRRAALSLIWTKMAGSM